MTRGITVFSVLCVSFISSCTTLPFGAVHYAVGRAPGGVLVEDLNGDGRLDLVIANEKGSSVSVLLDDGKGGFTPSRGSPFSAGPNPNDLAGGDFNGDRLADLAIANHETQHLTVLLGDGTGKFRQPAGSPFPCGDSPFNVAIGDVNADGKPDLAIVNSPSSTSDRSGQDGLFILIGDGLGAFTKMAGSPFVTGRFPNIPAIGDINGDGVGDVAVSNPDGDTITVFTMSGKGGLSSRAAVSVRGHPKGLALRDLNGDGKAEIVTKNNAADSVTVIAGE
jgi:FG-GAP-like repeat